jgi:hypothetical protein
VRWALAGAKQYKMKFSITDSQTRKSKFLPVLRLRRGKSMAVVLCQVTQIFELEYETAIILWLMYRKRFVNLLARCTSINNKKL